MVVRVRCEWSSVLLGVLVVRGLEHELRGEQSVETCTC